MNLLSIERWELAWAVAAISGTVLCNLGGCMRPSAPVAQMAKQSRPQAASGLDASTLMARREFRTLALDALLLPLLDVDVPARWGDPSDSLDCTDAQVTVDGDRLDVGAPVPRAFTVQWHMDRCVPVGPYMELSGAVELVVETTERGYAALVQPAGLKVVTAAGTHTLTEPFHASLAVDREGRP